MTVVLYFCCIECGSEFLQLVQKHQCVFSCCYMKGIYLLHLPPFGGHHSSLLWSTFLLDCPASSLLIPSLECFSVLPHFTTKSPFPPSSVRTIHQTPSSQFSSLLQLYCHSYLVSLAPPRAFFLLQLPPLNSCLCLHLLPLLGFQSHSAD